MKLLYVFAFILLMLPSCSKEELDYNAEPVIEHVVFIGIDGWDVTSYFNAEIPTIKFMKENGAWTLNKQSVFPTSSGPNWVSMFTGLCVEQHGYTQWGSLVPDIKTPYQDEDGHIRTIFSEIRTNKPNSEIGCFFEWNTIRYYIDTLSVNCYKQVDQAVPTKLSEVTVDYIKTKKPTVCAVIFDQLDHTGHLQGWDTEAYYSKLSELDGYISQIVKAVKDSDMYDSTVFIITSDHGGINKQHGNITENEMLAPLIVYGPKIQKGEIHEPVMQFDIASLILSLFDIEQPSSYVGHKLSIL